MSGRREAGQEPGPSAGGLSLTRAAGREDGKFDASGGQTERADWRDASGGREPGRVA